MALALAAAGFEVISTGRTEEEPRPDSEMRASSIAGVGWRQEVK